jgi:PKD repeat protein
MKSSIQLYVFKFTLGFTFLAILGCSKQPKACFEANPSAVEAGEAIQFSNCSDNSIRHEWDFGDGASSEGTSVSHIYDEPGNYIVTLVAFSKKDKKRDETSTSVKIEDPAEKFLGSYAINDNCTSNNWTYSISIAQGNPKEILMSNFGGYGIVVKANVEGKTISIPYQTFAFAHGTYYVNQSSGSLNSFNLTINYTMHYIHSTSSALDWVDNCTAIGIRL